MDVDVAARRVLVGPPTRLEVRRLNAIGARWCGPVSHAAVRLGVQVRAHGEEVPATAEVVPGPSPTVRVVLERRVRGVAPGQSVVLYEGTRVVGSATISETGRP